jgi:hypothetical protein
VTHVVTIIEPTQDIRDWLRGKPTISSTVGTDDAGKIGVYAGGLPKTPALPAVVVHRVGGAPDALGPVDSGLYQFDCWATKASDASLLAGVLMSLLLSTGTESIGTNLDVVGANVTGAAFFPDDKRSDLNRMSVTAQVVTRTRS